MIREKSRKGLAALGTCVILFAGACGNDSDSNASPSAEAEATVRAALDAENEKDADAFLKLWTDKGLEAYDSGTREEIESGEAENFGADPIEILKVVKTDVADDEKSADVQLDAAPRDSKVATPVYRVVFKLISQDDEWIIDGFEFTGSPPIASTADVIDIKAADYAFNVSKTQAKPEVGFTFENVGKEQHELTLFKAPDGTNITKALADLKDVDGQNLENIPDGYEAAHITFADIGDKSDVALADPLAKGTYVMACYIPQGGFGEEGPVNPDGKPHIELGMINIFTVA